MATNMTKAMEARRRSFLDALAITGVVTSACEAAGVARKTAYHWRDVSPAFADDWDEALATATDRLEAEARRRAVEGVEQVVMHRGQVVFKRDENGELLRDSAGRPVPMTVPVRSDRLLEILLSAKKPNEFGRRTVDVNQTVERRPRPAPQIDFKRMTPEGRELVRRLLEPDVPLFLPAPEGDGDDDPTRDAF